jgi:hypothetical protein
MGDIIYKIFPNLDDRGGANLSAAVSAGVIATISQLATNIHAGACHSYQLVLQRTVCSLVFLCIAIPSLQSPFLWIEDLLHYKINVSRKPLLSFLRQS